MCGINGIYSKSSVAEPLELVRRMNACIAHRGPDADGTWQNQKVVLGHRRLSIIDTSPAGNQPFFSQDKQIVVVFNGEIYNYLELKSELSGEYSFQTSSDTEVLIAAYLKWGIQCLDKFFGMFAFALWDNRDESLYIVRDRLGIKPLYFYNGNDALIFSSEIRAILSTGLVPRKISDNSLFDYLRYQTVHAPNTIIDNVNMLLPGHFLHIQKGVIKNHTWWSLNKNARRDVVSFDRWKLKSDIHDLLSSSVELRMRADVPFGAFLSGGIDSSILVGLMSKISTQKVKTFSVIFDEKEYDESSYSTEIAKSFATDHTPIHIKANEFLKLLPEALLAMDHPGGDGPNTYAISKVTHERGIKMAITGLGGDELFAGYDVFKRLKKLEDNYWLKMSPKFARTLAGAAFRALKPSIASDKIAESLSLPNVDFVNLYPLIRKVFDDTQIEKLLTIKNPGIDIVKTLSAEAHASGLDLLSKVSIAEMSTYMQNVLLRDADQMSMAHALELRVPFLDHRLVEYLLGVSDNEKYPHSPKQLLTEAFEGLIPQDIIHRPKMGFTFPWGHWMKNELRSFCEIQLHSLASLPQFHAPEIELLWQKFLKSDPRITWSRVWPLVVLGHWTKQHDVH